VQFFDLVSPSAGRTLGATADRAGGSLRHLLTARVYAVVIGSTDRWLYHRGAIQASCQMPALDPIRPPTQHERVADYIVA
jgi:hypothetical protein